MRLATFTHDSSTRLGVVEDGSIVDLAAAAPELPREMQAFLEAGTDALIAARAATASGPRLGLDDVRLEAPIARPPKFLAVGLNYADHVAESGLETPVHPMIFNKQSTCVTGPTDPVHLPRASHVLDYEGELGFVIGRRCRHVSRDDAADVIAGYCVVNDVSVRDWQLRVPTFTMGKSFDTHGPIGPWIVTAGRDRRPAPAARSARSVNGELRQETNTKELIFDCYHAGRVPLDGLHARAGRHRRHWNARRCRDRPQAAEAPRPGDVVRVEIEGIGEIENTVIAEPDDSGFVA